MREIRFENSHVHYYSQYVKETFGLIFLVWDPLKMATTLRPHNFLACL